MLNSINTMNDNFIDDENVMNLSPKYRKIWNEMNECRDEIAAIMQNNTSVLAKGYWMKGIDISVAAYVLARTCEYTNPISLKVKDMNLDENIKAIAIELGIDECWDSMVGLIEKYKQNIFYLVANLKNMNDPNQTPEGICKLSEKLLDIKSDDSVVDLCCGTGSVALSIKGNNPNVVVEGYDIDPDNVIMAKIYGTSYDSIAFEKRDIFELATDERKKKYSKIFANYPFGMRIKDLNAGKDYLKNLENRMPSISKATSTDWLYNMLMVDLMETGGRAIGVMTNGGTWNMIDTPIRKYFVENGLIETVISLPARLFPNTNISTTLIVFSENNKAVRMVDATEIFTSGRRVNELSDSDIAAILDAINEDKDISVLVDIEDLRNNDYVLNISRYMLKSDDIEDGVEFETVIKRITRGAPLSAKDLDKISSSAPTDMQYLMLANIKNGLIENDLPFLTEIEKKNEKYCLTNHCLILSKNGYPYKIAVAEVKENQRIMANGNLYIIELDEEKIDPYYLAAYLGSEQGTAALKSITVGATIPNIGVEQLKGLIIPVPPLEKQKEIADRYQALKDEIILLNLKIEKAKNKMSHIFEEGGKC